MGLITLYMTIIMLLPSWLYSFCPQLKYFLVHSGSLEAQGWCSSMCREEITRGQPAFYQEMPSGHSTYRKAQWQPGPYNATLLVMI